MVPVPSKKERQIKIIDYTDNLTGDCGIMDKTPALYPVVTQGTGANPRFSSLVSLRKELYLTFSSPPSCKVGTCGGSDGL